MNASMKWMIGISLTALFVSFSVGQDPASPASPVKPASPDSPAKTDGKETAANSKVSKKTNLFLLVRVGQDSNGKALGKKLLEQNFTSGMKDTKCKSSGDVVVKPISPSVYQDINKIVAGKTEEPWKVGLSNGIQMSLAEIDGKVFLSIKMPEIRDAAFQNLQMDWIDITPADATGRAKLGGKYGGDSKKPLQLIASNPDQYIIPWEYNAQIARVRAQMLEMDKDGNTKPREIFEEELVKKNPDQYFSLSVKDFEGEKETLFKYLQDKKNFVDTIKIGADLSEYVVQMASMGIIRDGKDTILNDQNQWLVSISKGDADKAWILFPLNKSQAGEAKAKFDILETPQDAFAEFEKQPNKVPLDAKAIPSVDGKTKPMWFELGANKDRFERSIQLGNLQELLDTKSDLEALVITVREFQNGRKELTRAKDNDFTSIVETNLRQAVEKKVPAVNQERK